MLITTIEFHEISYDEPSSQNVVKILRDCMQRVTRDEKTIFLITSILINNDVII